MIPHLVLAGIGFGLTIAPIAAAAINTSPELYWGTASALVIVFRLIGMTIGVSGMTTYGMQRANYLSDHLPTFTSMAEVARAGMVVAETVIHETFWIAASVCVLALVPILWLKRPPTERSFK